MPRRHRSRSNRRHLSDKKNSSASSHGKRRGLVESLETRRLLSTCALSSTGVLTLTGDMNKPDLLYVDRMSDGRLMVTVSGGTGMYVNPAQVKQIAITGGNYADRIYINPAITIPAVVHSYDGNDSVNTGGGNDQIFVGNGTDLIYSRDGNDTIVAGNGHDTIYGGTGNDSITAGNGGNLIYGEQGNDTIVSGSGNDTLNGADGNDSISAGGGNDYVEGDSGNDTLLGGDGNDTLVAGTGADVLDAGTGMNTYPDLLPEDKAPQGTVQSPYPQAAALSSAPLTPGGIVVNNDALVTGSNHGDPAAPTPVISLMGVTGAGPHSIFVHAVSSTLGSGTPLTAQYKWDFGDPGSRFNTLTGWNASHIYDRPGVYTIKLTLTNQIGKTSTLTTQVTVTADARRTIYVDNYGNDNNNGQTPQTAVKTVDRAEQLLGSGVRLLFHAGQTFNVDNSISVPFHDVLIGSYASGAKPVLNRVSGVGTSIIGMYDSSNQIVIQDLTMDSPWKPVGVIAEKMPADGIFPAGVNSAIRRVTFLNLDVGVDCDRNPTGTLVQDCDAPSPTGLRGCFIWGQGSDQVYLGNTVANSTREHNIRTVGTDRQLIAFNNLTNLDRRPLGDGLDYNKGTLDIHRGSYAYVDNNYFHDGELRTGPRGGPGEVPHAQTAWTVVEDNHVFDYSMEILPGTTHLMVRNNVFTDTNDSNITILPVAEDRNIADINIINNTGIGKGASGHFLYVYSGATPGSVTVRNNLWVAPTVIGGQNGTSAIFVADTSLKTFSSIANNVWQLPTTANGWGLGGVMYVYPSWGYQQGYYTPTKWDQQSVVSHDIFTSTPISSNLTPASNSAAATAALPVLGVSDDLYGNPRPIGRTWTAGAVQIAGAGQPVSTPDTTPIPTPSAKGSISGAYFYDSNKNGARDAGEAASPYWLAYIDSNNNGRYDTGEPQARGDAAGRFTFSGLAAGTYNVRSMSASGWYQTSPANGAAQVITLAAGQNLTIANFGVVKGTAPTPAPVPVPTPNSPGSISGTFFYDSNRNGVWDSGEAASPSWLLYIDANNNGRYDSGETQVRANTAGRYTFGGLAAGTYAVRSMTASGWYQTSPANEGAQIVTLSAGQNVSNLNFGKVQGTAPAPTPVPVTSTPRKANQTFSALKYDAVSNLKWDNYAGLGYASNGSWAEYKNIDFGAGTNWFQAGVASLSGTTGSIEVRLDSPTGTLAGTLKVTASGAWNKYAQEYTRLATTIKGVHNLFLVFRGSPVNLTNFIFA